MKIEYKRCFMSEWWRVKSGRNTCRVVLKLGEGEEDAWCTYGNHSGRCCHVRAVEKTRARCWERIEKAVEDEVGA